MTDDNTPITDIRTKMLNLLEGIRVRTLRDGEYSGLWPDDAERIVDKLISGLELSYEYENGRVMYKYKPAACTANGNWQYRIVSPHKEYRG